MIFSFGPSDQRQSPKAGAGQAARRENPGRGNAFLEIQR
jgi:hypothetical protein